jgi:hypothetical protein
VSRLADVALGAWFLLVAVSFWGPYLGMPLPANVADALYAAFLIVAVLALALRIVGRSQRRPEPPVIAGGDADHV